MDPTTNKAFGAIIVESMLEKLDWEISVLEDLIWRQDRMAPYAAWNAATTAWHIHETAFFREPYRSKVMAFGSFKGPKDYGTFVSKQSDALNWCRQMAINYRHAQINKEPDQQLSADIIGYLDNDKVRRKYVFRKDGVETPIVDVFKTAAKWWRAHLDVKAAILGDAAIVLRVNSNFSSEGADRADIGGEVGDGAVRPQE